MFNFTTTTVINSNADSSGLELFTAQAGSLNVKRQLEFKKENVVTLSKAPYADPAMDRVELDLSSTGASTGDVLRIALYIKLSMGSQSSYYANDLVFKGKPLYCEFIQKATAAATAIAAAAAFKKYQLAVYEKPIVKVSATGTKVVIEATDEYQRFSKAEVELYKENENPLKEGFESVVTGAVTTGTEGFGTYRWILHNFRLPTASRTSWEAINQDEAPILGAKYNQYTIRYCVNRGVMGGDAVGEVTKSLTTHVFYVNQAVATDFETALKTAFGLGANDLTVASEEAFKEIEVATNLASVADRVATLEAASN